MIMKHKSSKGMKTAEELAAEATAAQKEADRLREIGEKAETATAQNAASILMVARDMQPNISNIDLYEKAQEYINGKKSFKEFYEFCSTEMKKPEAVRTAAGHVEGAEKDMKNYSLAKALLAVGNPSEFGKLGIERELHN